MWRLLVFAGLLTAAVCGESQQPLDAEAAASSPAKELVKDEEAAKDKRSPASAVYGAQPREQYVVRPGEEPQELAPEYLALLQEYLAAQQQQQRQQHHHQHQAQPQPQHVPRGQLGALIEHELTRLADRPVQHKHHQGIPLDVEQYHVETSPRRPVQQQLYYPVEEQPQPQQQQPIHHAAPAPQPAPRAQPHQPEPQSQQLSYHQVVPIQYGYEDEQQLREQHQSPQAVVRAQAQAEAQALAFQKVAQASHVAHQKEALEQIRIANEKHVQQSALEQIRQGEAVSEAGRQERIQPKDPESAYKARLKAQATALVAEQRRAHEAAEYKAHADAILKLQAQQRAHLRAQEEAHHYALNFEKNQQRAQAQAQAVANAQALALYKARQQALNKAQNEAKQAARAQQEARKNDPDHAPIIQYLLPKNVPLPAPEVYLPKAAEALRAQAAHDKHLKKPHQPLKHLLLEEVEPQYLRRGPKIDEREQLAFLVDAGYYRKQQHQQQQHQQQQQRPHYHQAEYQGLEEVGASPRPQYQHYELVPIQAARA